ncbi:capsular biosynthesis protein [Microvirga tunisiensis]|uniref:Capsular biosynthesis protein n=1 Tax=Pannonibacter tanglangensis TaxID=2750084 RepID=A0A7X5F410_9HYPH|nr:capsular biosynthesis protein [Pannonibacter sp. XCT-53]NBN78355.1 capsular biosynthesis protein [Pannonibacter sp. XCT-53]
MLGAVDLELADPPAQEARAAPDRRHILFLQGPLCPLYARMGALMRQAGHRVSRINFCPGDWLHWRSPDALSYRGQPEAFRHFIEDYLRQNAVTDLVLHGDQRIYHKAAIAAAGPLGLQIAVTELGYLRPGYLTLERDGLSTLSRFPDDPDAIRALAAEAPEADLEPLYPGSFALEAIPDMIYNLFNVFAGFAYPHYQRHTLYNPLVEYPAHGMRLLGKSRRDAAVASEQAVLFASGAAFFVLPLQLEGDFQLRAHSPYASFAEVIETVIASFAAQAPKASRLVLKSHPLDAGFERWPERTAAIADRHGVRDRVLFFDGGTLGPLFQRAAGVVTLNSTAGLEAMQAGCPVKTLVPAHFDIRGLTHAGPLDGFWTAPQRPDPELLEDYIRAIAAHIQVRGSIHNHAGLEAAARNMTARILDRALNRGAAHVTPPPRLARARALGVPL